MLPPHLRPVLETLANRLESRFGVRFREVRLFGSYARGEATEDSDVDVLVLIDGLLPGEVMPIADTTMGLALESGIALAAVPMAYERYTPNVPGCSFVMEIERDGERP